MDAESRNVRKILQDKFEVWCDQNNVGSFDPLRRSYYKLYSLGADLNYVTALQDVLKDWDNWHNKPPKRDLRTSYQKELDGFEKRFSKELRAWFEDVGMRTSKRILEEVAKRYVHDSDAEGLAAELDISRIVGGVLFGREFDRITKGDAEPYNWVPRKRGNQTDFHGTIFLVLLTDYLREVSGKPHYGEAAMFLTSLRKSPDWPSTRRARRRATAADKPGKKFNPNLARQSAIVRCSNWKKCNPDWLDWLVDMKRELDGQAKKITNAQSKNNCI